MAVFSRGLGESFINALNKVYFPGSWWRSLVDDPDIFIAIRNKSLNAYYKGNSLIKLEFTKGSLVGKIHYKYLIKPDASPYVSIVDGSVYEFEPSSVFTSGLDDINAIKKTATVYSGLEKEGIHNIIKANTNVLDVEISLTKNDDKDEQEKKKGVKRIDIAALQSGNGEAILVFFEAKHFSNSELRSGGDTIPVVTQIEKYQKLIEQQNENISSAYLTTINELLNINGLANHSISDPALLLLKKIADGKTRLTVSSKPRLVIFGFDKDQKEGAVWKGHHEKLRAALGKDQVLMKGNSMNFVKGIRLWTQLIATKSV